MPEQYVASDSRTGLEVAVTGDFPPAHDDRIRIARTTTLFTRLMSTILATDSESMRRERFLAIETQLEMAEALIREDMEEVQRLMRSTLEKMGITAEQMDEMARRLLDQLPRQPGRRWADTPAHRSPAIELVPARIRGRTATKTGPIGIEIVAHVSHANDVTPLRRTT